MKSHAARILFPALVLLATGTLGAQTPRSPAGGDEAIPRYLDSARATLRTFLTAVDADDLDRAVECLDWSGTQIPPAERKQLAVQLKGVIDRMAWVDYTQVPDVATGEPYRFPPGTLEQPIVIARRRDGAWRFEPETVAQIGRLHEAWKDRPLLVTSPPWYRQMTPLGMELWRIIALLLSILIAWMIGQLLVRILHSMAGSLERRNRHYGAVTLQALSRAVVPLLVVLGLKSGVQFLVLSPDAESAADTATAILFAVAVGYAIWRLVDAVETWLNEAAARTSSKLDDMLAPMIGASMRVAIFVLALVQIATIVSDKPPSAIIAGLGVGGLAIGLAAQDTIKNFFGSLMIFSDRPFELGDRISAGNYEGTVESVGFRSTRVRTADGHLMTVPNGELANQAIRNVTKRPNIKRSIQLGLTYDTSPEKIREAIEILERLLKDHEGQDADLPARIYFSEFADSALVVQVTYWYHPSDWWAFSEFSQRLHLQILEAFNAANIELAFPTQTIHLMRTA